MLVACLPLLQPTGFCACKAAGSGCPSPHGVPVAAPTPCPVTAQKAACCSHRSINAEDHKTARPVSDRPAPCPTPGDDHHMPGCPASVGVDSFKWVEPAQSFAQTLPLPDVGSFLPLEVVLPVAVRSIPRVVQWPSSLPIYLFHCSLVI